MEIRTIYVKGNTHSPNPIENPDMMRVRLTADEGKALTIDSENFYLCIDVDSADGWIEVDSPPGWSETEVDSPPELSEMEEALRILGGDGMSRYIEKALKIRAAMDKAGAFLTDEQALTAVELYPPHKTGLSVKVGERYRYGNDLYKVIQEHVTQADWLPSITPALFVKVSLDEWPEFVQPTGQHDAYAFGAKITFNGKHYVSLITANTYSPLTYPAGWKLQ